MSHEVVPGRGEHEEHHGEVTSPDQHKPSVNPRTARIGGSLSVLVLVAMIFPRNDEGSVATFFLLGTAILLVVIMLVDWLLRKNGLKS